MLYSPIWILLVYLCDFPTLFPLLISREAVKVNGGFFIVLDKQSHPKSLHLFTLFLVETCLPKPVTLDVSYSMYIAVVTYIIGVHHPSQERTWIIFFILTTY